MVLFYMLIIPANVTEVGELFRITVVWGQIVLQCCFEICNDTEIEPGLFVFLGKWQV